MIWDSAHPLNGREVRVHNNGEIGGFDGKGPGSDAIMTRSDYLQDRTIRIIERDIVSNEV